jgi:hypothetical protein
MYLADKIAHCSASLAVEGPGARWSLPGASAFSELLSHCLARYVLLDDVREACRQLTERWSDLLDASNPKLRAPMEQAWIEWADPDSGERVGVLANAASDGRFGSMRIFWTQASEVYVAQGEVLFDFDRRVNSTHAQGRPLYALKAVPAEFAPLRPHLALAIDEFWADQFRATAPGPQGLPEASIVYGECLWPNVVRALAFFVLLASRLPFVERPVVRGRLNVARGKAGKPPLLDHVELRLGQAGSPRIVRRAEGRSGRKQPRLHVVRGHLVRRRDAVFWRVAHVRGGAGAEPPMPGTRLVRIG